MRKAKHILVLSVYSSVIQSILCFERHFSNEDTDLFYTSYKRHSRTRACQIEHNVRLLEGGR